MKNLFILCLLFLSLCNCTNKNNYEWSNNEFAEAIDNYCRYVDSIESEHVNEYLYIESKIRNDSTLFLITLGGGSYDFLFKRNRIINFFNYKGFDVLLLGDFPNAIVNIEKNKNLDVIEDVVKVRYPNDYNKFLKDTNSVAPLIYDFMGMRLVFRNNKLISCKRQYY